MPPKHGKPGLANAGINSIVAEFAKCRAATRSPLSTVRASHANAEQAALRSATLDTLRCSRQEEINATAAAVAAVKPVGLAMRMLFNTYMAVMGLKERACWCEQ
jgi:hypothetical protein